MGGVLCKGLDRKVNYAAFNLNFPDRGCDAFYNFSLNLAIKVFAFSPCERRENAERRARERDKK